MSIDVREPIPDGFVWIQDRVHVYLKKHQIPFKRGYKGVASFGGKLVDMYSGVVVAIQYGPQIEAYIKEKEKAREKKYTRSVLLYKKRKTEGGGSKIWKTGRSFDFSRVCDDVWNHVATFLHPIDVTILLSCTTWLHRNLRKPVWPEDETECFRLICRYVQYTNSTLSVNQRSTKRDLIFKEWSINEERDKNIIQWVAGNRPMHRNNTSYHLQAAVYTGVKWLYDYFGWRGVYKYGKSVYPYLRKKYALEHVSLRDALQMFKTSYS